MTALTPRPDAALASAADPWDLFDEARPRFLATRNNARTRQTYATHLRAYDRAILRLGLDPLGGDALIAYSNELEAQRRDNGGTLANDTVRGRLNALSSFFTWLYTYGLSPLKPELVSDLITKPPARKLSPRDILTADEAKRLLATAHRGRDLCLIRLMLDNGLRCSEALALSADDIYTASDRFYTHVARGKGDKARDVETRPDLYESLKNYRSNGRLFYIHRATAYRVVTRTAQAAGIEKQISPHSLRHTHAHELRLAGWPLEAIADRLGHANLETTKFYTRPAELARVIPLPAMPWE